MAMFLRSAPSQPFFIHYRTLLASNLRHRLPPSHRWTAPRSVSSQAILGAHPPVTTTLHYLKPLELYKTVKPYHINIPSYALPSGFQSNEETFPVHDIQINDIRSSGKKFELDVNGFQFFSDRDECKTRMDEILDYEEYADGEAVRTKYRAGVENFLTERLGAEFVYAFTSEVRRREGGFPVKPRGEGSAPQPVQGVHVGKPIARKRFIRMNIELGFEEIDFTPRWALNRLRMLFSDECVDNVIMKRRWQVLNTWRPIFGPLEDWPLAVCDYTSLNPNEDLVPSDNVYTHMVSETYNVYHRDYHKWYFLQNMQPYETLVFKSFDSLASKGVAQVCPHAAFYNPLAPSDARARESVECIAFVVYPEGNDFEELQAAEPQVILP